MSKNVRRATHTMICLCVKASTAFCITRCEVGMVLNTANKVYFLLRLNGLKTMSENLNKTILKTDFRPI